MAEPVALHLVVAHLGDELRPERRLLELAGAPAVRLREAAVGASCRAAAARARRSRRGARADRRRADVVELAVVAVEPEQQRRELLGFVLFQRTPTTTQSAVLCSFTFATPRASRAGRAARAASRSRRRAPRPRSVASQPRASSARRAGEIRKSVATFAAAPAPLLERQLVHRLAVPEQHVEGDELRGDLGRELRTRLSAGCSRVCIESKSSAPSRAITISPSSAEWGGSRSPSGAARGSSGAAAARSATRARARRRRSRARRGSRPTSARTASPRRRAARGRARPPSAGRGRSGRARRGSAIAWAARRRLDVRRAAAAAAAVRRPQAHRRHGGRHAGRPGGSAVRRGRARARYTARSRRPRRHRRARRGRLMGRRRPLGRELGSFAMRRVERCNSSLLDETVAVTGLGAITPLGLDARPRPGTLPSPARAASTSSRPSTRAVTGCRIAGEVKGFDAAMFLPPLVQFQVVARGRCRRSRGGRCRSTTPTSLAARTRATSASVSTSVPTWGCRARLEAVRRRRSRRSRPGDARAAPTRASPSSMRGDHAASTTAAATKTSAPAAASSAAMRSASRSRASSAAASWSDERHEAAHEAQSVAVQQRAQRDGVERQVAERAELGRVQPERGHLAQDALGRELQAPAGDLADAPGDGRAGQAAVDGSGAGSRSLQGAPPRPSRWSAPMRLTSWSAHASFVGAL